MNFKLVCENVRSIQNHEHPYDKKHITYELEIAKFMHSFYYGFLKTLVTNLNLHIHNTHIIQEPWQYGKWTAVTDRSENEKKFFLLCNSNKKLLYDLKHLTSKISFIK